MAAFEALRKKQEPDAQRLFKEAIMQFRQGNQAEWLRQVPGARREGLRLVAVPQHQGAAQGAEVSRRLRLLLSVVASAPPPWLAGI